MLTFVSNQFWKMRAYFFTVLQIFQLTYFQEVYGGIFFPSKSVTELVYPRMVDDFDEKVAVFTADSIIEGIEYVAVKPYKGVIGLV